MEPASSTLGNRDATSRGTGAAGKVSVRPRRQGEVGLDCLGGPSVRWARGVEEESPSGMDVKRMWFWLWTWGKG